MNILIKIGTRSRQSLRVGTEVQIRDAKNYLATVRARKDPTAKQNARIIDGLEVEIAELETILEQLRKPVAHICSTKKEVK